MDQARKIWLSTIGFIITGTFVWVILLKSSTHAGIHTLVYPHVIIPSGALVRISESETAKIYGPDLCLRGYRSQKKGDYPECTVLTAHSKFVDVRFKQGGEEISEEWQILIEYVKNDRGDYFQYQLTRPNGWIIRSTEK